MSFTLIANVIAIAVIAALAVLYWRGRRHTRRPGPPHGRP
jgi:type II secretory pathway component PulJ